MQKKQCPTSISPVGATPEFHGARRGMVPIPRADLPRAAVDARLPSWAGAVLGFSHSAPGAGAGRTRPRKARRA